MNLTDVLSLPATQALLRYQQENPHDRQARLVFTDYLRDYDLPEIADCVGRSLAMSGAVVLPDSYQFACDGWLTAPIFEIGCGVSMQFCWIPAGKAVLGSVGDMARTGIDKEYEFTTKGFWLGKYEVTQEQWNGVIGSEPSRFKGARLPVESVSWDDCQNFIKKCSVPKMKIRLPYEDEWEYACLGGLGNKRAYYWGDTLNGDKANCYGKSPYGTEKKGVYLKRTTEVGRYETIVPHPWGLCDMSGNVFEWCDNLDTRASGERGTVRSGSWDSSASACRSVCRRSFPQQYAANHIGLRLALVPWAKTSEEN